MPNSNPARPNFRLTAIAAVVATTIVAQGAGPALSDDTPAKQLFGSVELPADMTPKPVGFYSKGCLAGGAAMPVDGPDWQVMRLSRNRRWGHPDLVRLLQSLSVKAKQIGWNGLLIGDMSQPRGGPMLTGHASHQIGLDADIWFTPMPDHRMTYKEREETSAISTLKAGSLYVDDKRWTPAYTALLEQAASYSEVERILVHPGVKKKLCDTVKGNRAWLAKIRPYYGHYYHFHLRIKCPKGASDCKPQNPPPAGDGCDKSILDWWFDVALAPQKPAPPPKKPVKPRYLKLSDLPGACKAVLAADPIAADKAEIQVKDASFSAPPIDIPEFDKAAVLSSKPIETGKASAATVPLADVPIPTPRPTN